VRKPEPQIAMNANKVPVTIVAVQPKAVKGDRRPGV
jgi:hypothetical protein